MGTNLWFLSILASFALVNYAGPLYGTILQGKQMKNAGCESIVTEVQDNRLVFEAFLRPCGSELPVLEASNTAVLDFHAYFFIKFCL